MFLSEIVISLACIFLPGKNWENIKKNINPSQLQKLETVRSLTWLHHYYRHSWKTRQKLASFWKTREFFLKTSKHRKYSPAKTRRLFGEFLHKSWRVFKKNSRDQAIESTGSQKLISFAFFEFLSLLAEQKPSLKHFAPFFSDFTSRRRDLKENFIGFRRKIGFSSRFSDFACSFFFIYFFFIFVDCMFKKHHEWIIK